MLIKYNAALCSKGKRWSKPANELTKPKLMVLCNRPHQLFYSKHVRQHTASYTEVYHVVSLTLEAVQQAGH